MNKSRFIATVALMLSVCMSVWAWDLRYENGEGDVRIPTSALDNKKVIDTSVAECVYEHYVYDPYKKRSEIKTDRKSFNRMMREFCMDAGSFLAGNPLAPTTVDGKSAVKKRRLFFNPIELD